MQIIHYNIKPIDVLLREEYLYDLKEHHNNFIPAKIIAISSYPGHTLTFTVLVHDKYIFSYIPIIALAWFITEAKSTLERAVYKNCPSAELTVAYYDALNECTVFKHDGSYLSGGTYLLSVDWYNDNELLHLIKLDDGTLALYPNHKIVFGKNSAKAELPKYKKLHHEWILK